MMKTAETGMMPFTQSFCVTGSAEGEVSLTHYWSSLPE